MSYIFLFLLRKIATHYQRLWYNAIFRPTAIRFYTDCLSFLTEMRLSFLGPYTFTTAIAGVDRHSVSDLFQNGKPIPF